MTVPTYQEFLTCAITPFPTSEIIYVSEKDRRYSMGGFNSIAAIYNVKSLESDTILYNKPGIFSHGFIDGEYFKDVPMSYRFKSLGSHQVILYLKDIEIIPDAAFRYCNELYCVRIPPTVRKVGSDAFRDCPGLDWVKFESDMPTERGSIPFENCTIYMKKETLTPDSIWWRYLGRLVTY